MRKVQSEIQEASHLALPKMCLCCGLITQIDMNCQNLKLLLCSLFFELSRTFIHMKWFYCENHKLSIINREKDRESEQKVGLEILTEQSCSDNHEQSGLHLRNLLSLTSCFFPGQYMCYSFSFLLSLTLGSHFPESVDSVVSFYKK